MVTNLVGKILGQYELVKLIGQGTLADVYKAYQPSLKRWAAVKVLHDDQEETLIRFQREAKAVARLRHRNILVVYEYGQALDYPYIAMELVEQGTLKDYLKGEPMIWGEMVRLALPLAEALRYAHKQELIHRDVKPSNILLPQADWPLLADFGLVKISNAEQSITGSGVVIGTPAYMAPEQARGEKVDHRADIYALGVLMFEMITGRLPFIYDNPLLLMRAHISEAPASPRQFHPTCPPELEQVILTALQKSPHDRYADMQALIEALEYVLGLSTLPTSAELSHFSEAPTDLSGDEFPARPPVVSPERSLSISANPPIWIETSSRPMARLVLPDQNVTLDLPDPGEANLIIGRTHDQSHVEIDLGPYGAVQAGISRRHARLTRQETAWLITDLNSLNGTYVNEVKLTPATPIRLKSGDVIRCSRLTLVFLLPAEM